MVVGLGAMGSSALYHLARRGVDVVGIEQFEPGHVRGSSHGHSRVFRTTYDDPLYVELARESLGMWRELEIEADVDLLELCGLLIFASLENDRFTRTLKMLADAGLPHDLLTGPDVPQRFPTFRLTESQHAFFARENGFVRADQVLETLRNRAEAHGAVRRDGCRVESIEPLDSGLRVKTDQGTIDTARAVITAGAWLDRLAGDLNWNLEVTREEKIYLPVNDPAHVTPDVFPCFCEYDTTNYGFPSLDGRTIKVAADHSGQRVDPDSVDRDVSAQSVGQLYDWVERWQPGLVGTAGRGEVCLYTNTPDHDFLIGSHPSDDRLVLGGGFSGHGFKFSILVGDILADLVLDGHTRRQIARFAVDRFL
ncbi:MAG TPA: N-methyl-L-tryptophan oxidase [Planctomycetaceae bacterium]|nr:N-methyl-L-tryptophan oxidase [Planctomycetaceae bacterium]